MNFGEKLLKIVGNLLLLSLLSASLLWPGAYATVAESSFYFGVDLGKYSTEFKRADLREIFNVPPAQQVFVLGFPKKIDDSEFAVRLFMGSNIHKYLGWEFGVAVFPDAEAEQIVSGTKTELDWDGVTVDLSAKAQLPMERFGVYVKGGIAYSAFSTKLRIKPMSTKTMPIFKNTETENDVTTVFGVGVSFAVTEAFLISAFWERYQAHGDIPDIDFYGLSLSYHLLKNRGYCGEFLC